MQIQQKADVATISGAHWVYIIVETDSKYVVGLIGAAAGGGLMILLSAD